MKLTITILLFCLFGISCNSNDTSKNEENKKQSNTSKQSTQVVIKEDNLTKTVDIDSFILITNDVESQRADAKAIMAVKRRWPLAMQTKDRNLFDSILAREFTFKSATEFYNRQDYIEDRVNSPVIVDTAEYENLVLQFFGGTALLTYRNIVTGKDSSGKAQKAQFTWADIYLKEDGVWKIGGSHLIQVRRLN